MLRIAFTFIVIIHSLIHLLGFVKAYGLVEVEQLSSDISRPAGLIWLLTSILFLVGAVLFLFHKDSWPEVVLLAVLFSQVLIFTFWQDAKIGSITNVIILMIAFPTWGSLRFEKQITDEQREFLEASTSVKKEILTIMDLKSLPPIVQKWLKYSGVVNKPIAGFVRFRQVGKMKTKPDGNWMAFKATQYVNPSLVSFIWQAKVKMMPLIYLQGRDCLTDGIGEMQIRLLGGFDVVNESDNLKINSGAMIRYLAEMCWYPTAALNNNVEWQEITPLSARATVTYKGVEVSGVFNFNEDGSLKSFEADRYYGGDANAVQERWVVEIDENREFKGYTLPSKCTVTWKLPEGDFTWLELDVIDLDVNKRELY